MADPAPGPSVKPSSAVEVLARERNALAAHRAAWRGSDLPPPGLAPKGTFMHGFFLPFSLIAAMLRDGELRGPYLRLLAFRGLVVVLVGIVAIAGGNVHAREGKHGGVGIVVHRDGAERGERAPRVPPPPVHVDIPGLKVDIDEKNDQASVKVLGQNVPAKKYVKDETDAPPPVDEDEEPAAPTSMLGRLWQRLRQSWAWMVALVTILSATEGIVVFFSRRWDDWLSFHASKLVAIRPEDEVPKTPKLALDLRWLYRKLKRRARGYVVFAAGVPALLPLRLVPTAGNWLFTIAATLWGWYWLGVFSAAKSAHAWSDEEQALSPAPIRTLNQRVSSGFVLAPLRWYGRAWARITHSVNPAATTFERSPTAFLGLALARVILSLPGLYLLARPVVPVAAGRLCAEADPAERFSVPSAPARAA